MIILDSAFFISDIKNDLALCINGIRGIMNERDLEGVYINEK